MPWLLFLKALPWKTIGPIIGVIAVLGMVWYMGWHTGDQRATKRIAAYEKQIADKGAKIVNGQFAIDAKVVTLYKTKKERIYVERETNKKLAETVKPTGNLSAGWVYVHNLGAVGGTGEPKKASDPTDSGVSTPTALSTVLDNYAVCRTELSRLEAWQKWYQDSQANIAAVNKGKSK